MCNTVLSQRQKKNAQQQQHMTIPIEFNVNAEQTFAQDNVNHIWKNERKECQSKVILRPGVRTSSFSLLKNWCELAVETSSSVCDSFSFIHRIKSFRSFSIYVYDHFVLHRTLLSSLFLHVSDFKKSCKGNHTSFVYTSFKFIIKRFVALLCIELQLDDK